MTNRLLLACLACLACLAFAPPAGACLKIGSPPLSWRKASASGRYVFVLVAPDQRDDFHSRASQAQLDEVSTLRARYPRSGMYLADTGDLLWTTDHWLADQWSAGPVTAWVSDDGESAVWTSAIPTDLRRHRGPIERALLGEEPPHAHVPPFATFKANWARPALTIQTRGRPLVTYTHGRLIQDSAALSRNRDLGQFVPWLAELELDGSQLLVTTHDDQTLTFDLTTGDLTDRRPLRRLDRHLEPAVIGIVVMALVAARLRRWQAKPVPAASVA